MNAFGERHPFEPEPGRAHFDAKRSGGLATGDNAAVVVTQYTHRFVLKVWPEHRLAAGVKRVRINKGKHQPTVFRICVTTPKISSESSPLN